MSQANCYLCGVPKEECVGGKGQLWEPSMSGRRTHSSPLDAFACMRRYLLKNGYVQGQDSRSFIPPDGGSILVLTKKTRFGGRLRRGKSEGIGKGASRYMPKDRMSGMVHG